MLAAEDDFEAAGHTFPRRRVHHSQRRPRPAWSLSIQDSGTWPLSPSPPRPPSKRTTWTSRASATCTRGTRTQDEGWVRAALDYYGVPYTYFADQKLRDGNLRAKYDVIIFPHVGGTSAVACERHSDDRQRSRSPIRNPNSRRISASTIKATTSAAAWEWKAWRSSRSSCRKAAR